MLASTLTRGFSSHFILSGIISLKLNYGKLYRTTEKASRKAYHNCLVLCFFNTLVMTEVKIIKQKAPINFEDLNVLTNRNSLFLIITSSIMLKYVMPCNRRCWMGNRGVKIAPQNPGTAMIVKKWSFPKSLLKKKFKMRKNYVQTF